MLDVITGKVKQPRRIMLYGTHGIGKSTFGSMAPNPIFIQTEDGLDDIDCAKFPLCEAYGKFIERLGQLYSSEHDFQTVVVDSADWLERLIWADVCKSRGVESIEDIGYAKGYQFSLTQWREVIDGLDALRHERGMSVILLAHAKIERFENPETDSYDRYSPRLHKTASHILQEWCNEVLFACYKVYTTKSKEGFNKERAVGKGVGERVIYTTERPAHVAKNRLNLPDEIPLDWTAFAPFLAA